MEVDKRAGLARVCSVSIQKLLFCVFVQSIVLLTAGELIRKCLQYNEIMLLLPMLLLLFCKISISFDETISLCFLFPTLTSLGVLKLS